MAWDETLKTNQTKDDDDETAVDKREQKRLNTIDDIVSISATQWTTKFKVWSIGMP